MTQRGAAEEAVTALEERRCEGNVLRPKKDHSRIIRSVLES